MNNYLIAVGGTGQHIALCLVDYLALAHLTTNGKFPVPNDSWKIILIDADQEKSQEERSAWGHCREQVRRLSVAGISIKAVAHKPVEVLDQMFGETTPATLLSNLSDSPAIADILLDLLFTSAQSKVRIMDGFFGEPRVASFIGGRWLRDVMRDPNHDLGALAGELAAGPDETRVALAGSSAGGTGAGLLEPLRKWLVSISPQAAASVCVDVGLEWFKISGTRNNALSMRMRHNAASCLFPFLKTNNTHRLGIWGHPSVAAATEESDQSDTRQAVKQNLTLPWFGTSILVNFYSGVKMPPTAAAAADRVSLRGLLTPHHNFSELIEANRRVVGRLRHTQTYLRQPYAGAVLPIPFFRRRGRVATLDNAHPNLERRVTQLLDAKAEALERLRVSEALNGVGQIDVAYHPVYSTRLLNQLYATSADPAVCAQPIGEAMPDGSTQGRLLPEHATLADGAAGDAVPRGSLAPLAPTERTGLADLDLIAATRIPSLSGVRDLIAAFIGNNAVWKGSLASAQKPIAPALLRRPTDDRARDWMRRWLLVFRALMAGALRRYALQDVPAEVADDLSAAQVNVDEILIYEYKGHQYVAGYLDPDYVVIPSLGRIWETEETLKALVEQSGGISRLLTWVNLATRFVGKGRSPDWAKLLDTEFKGAMQLDSLTAGKETIQLRWNGTDLSAIPLPADSGGAKLDIAVQRSVPSDQTSAPPEILAQLAKLEIGKQQIYLRRDLKNAFPENFLGTSVAGPNGTSVSLDGAKVLEEDEVFTPVVVQLKNTPVPYTLPIRAEHAEHVASCSYSMSGSTLAVTLTLKNPAASRIEKRYSADQILTDAKLQVSLYLWPSHAQTTQRGLWALVSGEGLRDRDVRLLTSESEITIESEDATTTVTIPATLFLETDWLRLAKRNRISRVVPAENAPKRRPSLVALRVDLGSGGTMETGLIPYLPSKPIGETWSGEQWCVDFGTSSTVVAVRRNTGERTGALILRIRGEADSTIPVLAAHDVPRGSLRWFDTWDGQSAIARPLAGEMPSHVLVLNEDQKINPELGLDYVVDLGWTLNEKQLNETTHVRERLKWSSDPLRAAYNRDVLETMLQIRLRTGGRIPAVLPVTFTLPYRQVTTLDDFKKAIDKAIAQVQNSFGVEIKPSFLWESHALRPSAVIIGKGIFVAADLGGGTLDLYAARYEKVGDKFVIAEEIIDSAKVGADYLVQSWSNGNIFQEVHAQGHQETAVYKAAIRSGQIGADSLRRANDTEFARRYWNTLRRYISVWSTAVATHWQSGNDPTTVTFERLGLGWELYDRTGLPPFTETMNNMAEHLGQSVRFKERIAVAEGRSRKEELAHRALLRTSDAVSTIEQLQNAQPNMVIGMPLEVGGSLKPAHTFLHQIVPVPGGMQPPDFDAAQTLMGASRPAVEWVIDHLNKEQQDHGYIITAGGVNRLAVSPLTVIAERMIDDSETF